MVPRIPSWTKGVAVAVLPVPPRPFVDKRCCSCSSPCPSASLRGQKVLQLQFSVSLRVPSWTKGVAVAVLRGPPWPFVDKRCCSCSSPCPSVALRGQKVLQLQFSVSLRVPSWTKGVAVAVLRGPSVALRGQKVLQLQFSVSSVALRGQKVLQLQFSVSLRVPSWTKGVAVAVLRGPPRPFVDKRCCSCSSPWSSVALRGQKVLQLQFSVSLRGPSWTKGVAVAVLRVPPWPFVDKRCCSCSSPCPSVALRGQKVLQLQFSVVLRGPSWTKGVAVLQFSVSLRGPSWTKGVAVAVLRVPPRPVAVRGQKVLQFCSSPCPSVALRGQKVLQLQFSVSLRGSKSRSSCPIVYISG